MEKESDAAAGLPPSKRRRAEEDDWTVTLEYQNKYGYRRYSIDSAQLDVKGADGAYVPFKVRAGERGETEIHIVVAHENAVAYTTLTLPTSRPRRIAGGPW